MKVVPREPRLTLFVLPSMEDEELFFIVCSKARKNNKEEHMAHCPECEAEITVQGLLVGEILYCPDCNAELEVLTLEPPAVGLAPQVEEDWGE